MNSNGPALCYRTLHRPKQGHSEAEYEDAWLADAVRGRFAVADGASESAFAGLWARLLVDGFGAAARPRRLAEWLSGARGDWSAAVRNLELPWYAEIKRDEGAFATFLGLDIHPPRWSALAVGDSCLVRVRENRAIRAFPLTRAADFGNQPPLLRSHPGLKLVPRRCSGTLRPDDRLFLMTDALAQWFLSRHEAGERPWEALAAVPAEADFAAWVEEQRGAGMLRDDDVTLVSISPSNAC